MSKDNHNGQQKKVMKSYDRVITSLDCQTAAVLDTPLSITPEHQKSTKID